MISEQASHADIVERFAKHARAGAVMTIVGAVIIAASFGYSAYQFDLLQRSKMRQTQELQSANAHVKALQQQAVALQVTIDHLNERARAEDASFSIMQLGMKKFFRHDYIGAIPYYDRAISVDPENPVLFDVKGYALLRAGRIDDAVASLQHAVALDDRYIWGHYNLALAYWAHGNHGGALHEVASVVKIDPAFRDVMRGDRQFSPLSRLPEFQRIVGVRGTQTNHDRKE